MFFAYGRCVNGQPKDAIVYTNRVGDYENRFVIGPADMVSGCRYRLMPDDSVQFDRLTFVRDVEFPDGRDNSPAVVRGWEYKGTDKTENAWRIIFSKEEGAVPGTYPVYYSFETGGNFERWLLPGGTRRHEGTLADKIKAVVWANQLDVDRLGLRPFNERQQSPISVILAWRSIERELAELLNRFGTSISSQSLLRGPDGRLHMNVSLTGDRASNVAETLGIRNNVELDSPSLTELRTISAKQISSLYLTNGRPDLNKVQGLLADLIRGRSEALMPYQFKVESKSLANGCFAISAPWQLLTCGDEYCQLWRIRFAFLIERKEGQERYQISTEFDIGECRVSERQFGDDKVIWRSTSKDASEFENLSAFVANGGEETNTVTASVKVFRSIAPGYSVYNPMSSFSLKQTLDRAFADYVSAIVGSQAENP
jgi:hypothetical protein